MKIAFVLNDLGFSGGTNVIVQHAFRLAGQHGHHITLLLRQSSGYSWLPPLPPRFSISSLEGAEGKVFDIAVWTYWDTFGLLGQVEAEAYVWFCQSFEDRFFPDRNPNVTAMQIVGSIPLPVITEAHWIRDLLIEQNPTRRVEVVQNGIDKDVFAASKEMTAPSESIDVLVEGPLDSDVKNSEYALRSALQARRLGRLTHVGDRPFETTDSRYHFLPNNQSAPAMADLYRDHHVLLKTSRVEGMFGPPLEAFHCGVPAIVTPVTGAEEYIVHGKNAVVVPWDDEALIADTIDRLCEERGFWTLLREGAQDTASNWPDWDSQSEKFEVALIEVATSSKLNRNDLRAIGEAVEFNNLMHWLAMRRLSDKEGGRQLVRDSWREKFGSAPFQEQ